MNNDKEEMDDGSDNGSGVEEMEIEEDATAGEARELVWDPSRHELEDGEELEFDESAYRCMHELSVEWPCLSLDVISDSLGFMRKTWPQTVYMICGTQAAEGDANRLIVMKVRNVSQTKQRDVDAGMMDDDDDDEDDLPIASACKIKQRAAINRVRVMPQNSAFAAAWSENKCVSVYNVAPLLRSLDDEKTQDDNKVVDWKPVAGFEGHGQEGFAMAWSALNEGSLVTGDCGGVIHLWEPEMVGARKNWKIDTVGFRGHEGSVEDLAWSPNEARVFASCSTDKTVRLWDSRGKKTPVLSFAAHTDEVNVITWNALVPHLLASGCDNGVWKVHDLRKAGTNESPDLFTFGFHKSPVTSIEWCPFEDSMISVSSADDSVSIWDLSATHDDDQPAPPEYDEFLKDVPEQLLFLHRGLEDPKEAHWHKQIPGMLVATAANGLHIFAPDNICPQ